jgi:uncharacterized membrane protein YhaH (DUF805 family)
MTWYFDVLRKYAVFSGRARRKEYWMFLLVNFILGIVLGIVQGVSGVDLSIPVVIYELAILVPSMAVAIRRMHDTDHSGWWVFVPIVNIVLTVREGQRGRNRFGADPKAEEDLVATAA